MHSQWSRQFWLGVLVCACCATAAVLFTAVTRPVARRMDGRTFVESGTTVLDTTAVVGFVLETGARWPWYRAQETGVRITVIDAKYTQRRRVASCRTAVKVIGNQRLPGFVRCDSRWLVLDWSDDQAIRVYSLEPNATTALLIAEFSLSLEVREVVMDDNLEPSEYDFWHDRSRFVED